MRRLFQTGLTAVGLACLLLSQTIAGAQETVASPKRPNVILIMTDNHGAWTLGCYGNKDIRTPNIDRLAAEGTLFTRAFASNPVCSPTRATCLTGLLPSQHGVHSFLAGGRLQTGPNARCTLDAFTSLPEVLDEAGYRCGLVGKWHLGGNQSPQEGLDDYWITMPHGGTSTFYDARIIEDGEIRTEAQYLTDFWTDHAVKFINQQKEDGDPFFLFLAYNGPYSLGRLLLRDGQNRHAAYYADKEVPSFPRETPHPWQLNNLDYINNPTSIRRVATEVSGVDDGVGKVMQTLEQRGIDDNTIVIFVADQGWVGGHGGFFGMGDHTRPLTARDGMMQIPLIWHHPGQIAAGRRSEQMIANYDVMPTLLGHLGMADKMPSKPQSPGLDHSEALKHASTQSVPRAISKPIFYEFENLRCIRTETMKYVRRFPNGPNELYDLTEDPNEFVNLINDPAWQAQRRSLRKKLDDFYRTYAEPKYDMWNGGTSQVRIHDGVDEELAQLEPVDPPKTPADFQIPKINVPDGYSVELVAGPPLVTHPTLGCFDDSGHLYVCNNAGVNLSSQELEAQLPNSIRRLSDRDGDGRFDHATVFAEKMTFPMGGAWHAGSLYVASPPNIWKLTDTDDDGVADKREIIVEQFGYTGNAASIHGCFFGADGRMYWCDGFHGHEFKDDDGNVTSKREGSYIFSCLPDGSDVQILAGGGMDNPVEVDFTESGDVLGTVNILYTRPRVDCLVHWLYGGAYPHRQRVLNELKTTGEVLGPMHRFGHVAISGMTRYRSGVMNHAWGDNLFATFFNHGKVVRLEIEPSGSTWQATQHEFLSSESRDFHPTDVIEDADGSLLVVDTGGWFYRGCPTSQFAKPDLHGGIYRVRRDAMTTMVDPRGTRIDWSQQSATQMMRLLNDTRFEVRNQAITECVKRGKKLVPTLKTYVTRGDIRVRRNCLWALARLSQRSETATEANEAIALGLNDRVPSIRKLAVRSLGFSSSDVDASLVLPLLADDEASVRREAATTLGKIGDASAVNTLIDALDTAVDRSEEHAIIYALIEINDSKALKLVVASDADPKRVRAALIALDQMDSNSLSAEMVAKLLDSDSQSLRKAATSIVEKNRWSSSATELLTRWLSDEATLVSRAEVAKPLIQQLSADPKVASVVGRVLRESKSEPVVSMVFSALASNASPIHASWRQPISDRLLSGDFARVESALAVIGGSNSGEFKEELTSIGGNSDLPAWLRLRALSVTQAAKTSPNERMFDLIKEIFEDSGSPQNAMHVARSLSALRLTRQQLVELTPYFAEASPMLLREMIKPYGRFREPEKIHVFLDSVRDAKSFLTLPETELSDVVKRFPQETLSKANQLLDKLKQHRQEKQEKLSRLLSHTKGGDPDRGKTVFMGEKAKCNTCHQVGGQGKAVGPDLTTIGANRSASDLLESIVLPSASIVRDYGAYKLLTDDGKAIVGLLAGETTTAVTIQQSTGEMVTVQRDSIEVMQESPVSIMPNGLDEALSDRDLADVISYLRSLK